MVEVDNTVHQLPKAWKNVDRSPVPFLLTKERTQALDLLTHLVFNTSDSILVCGPEGVGKSRLLDVFQSSEKSAGAFCRIEGEPELDLSRIKQRLDTSRKPVHYGRNSRFFDKAIVDSGISPQKTVLIIDNAGAIRPGLCSRILHYADGKPELSVILALTHDQLQIKYRSDPVLEEAHIVELTPLTEKQCGDFVQHLAAQASVGNYPNSISDDMAAEIYQHTHGLPARIIAGYGAAPKIQEDNPGRTLVAAVLILIVVALAVQWYSSRPRTAEPEPLHEPAFNSVPVEIDLPYFNLPISDSAIVFSDRFVSLGDGENPPLWQGFEPGRTAFETSGIREAPANTRGQRKNDSGFRGALASRADVAEIESVSTREPSAAEKAADIEPLGSSAVAAVAEGGGWLISQPHDNYTLQLMVLSKRQSIFDVINKYPSLRKDFKYIERLIKNKERFVLLYGSFPDAASAKMARNRLPAEFARSMIRKIGTVRSEFK
ncbi:MAG: hypothetical protein ACU841_15345 [Gammaproteobacteria bacterium]